MSSIFDELFKRMKVTTDHVSIDPNYGECKEHGKYKKIFMIDGKEKSISHCPKCVANQKTISILGRSGIQKRFLQCKFENYEITRKDQQDLVMYLRDVYVKNFSTVLNEGRNITMSGSVGTGKTHLACAVANEVAVKGHGVYFATVSAIVKAVKASWKKDTEKTEEAMIQDYSSIELLIIDEIGANVQNEHDDGILFDIINRRYEAMLPTIYLTNLDSDELMTRVGERICDRMKHGGKFIPMDWESYRK